MISTIPLHGGFCSAPDGGPRQEFGFFAGYSPVTATVIGTATDRRFVVAGFGYGYRCWIWKSASLSFTPAIMPAAILLQPSQILENNFRPQISPPHAVYGFATAPLGFTLDVWRLRRVHPFVETIEGLIVSTEPIPENQPNATGLNFMFDLGGGVHWNPAPRRVVTAGYRFLHISNASTTSFNPGLDNNVFYVGYSFLR